MKAERNTQLSLLYAYNGVVAIRHYCKQYIYQCQQDLCHLCNVPALNRLPQGAEMCVNWL